MDKLTKEDALTGRKFPDGVVCCDCTIL